MQKSLMMFSRSLRVISTRSTGTGLQVRGYTEDKLSERERGAELMYIHNLEKEKIKALKQKLEEASKKVAELEKGISEINEKK
ncbi:hypothetical protein BB561_001764 [Smittium simulii]|uniref:ATPase inhibitor, mitochondrial n=1 Tax=Smittium simulii TaxID=133385 RepID=A0A2T9YT55_9FUNG|nr:hypothetical protein BB561_001764 [Smittium simulii]